MRTVASPLRLVAVLGALALVLAACGGTADPSVDGDAGTDATDTTEATETTEAPDTTEATEPEGPATDLTIVATTTILGDVLRNVVDGDAVVEVLMPIGADPHDFQASSAQVAAVNGADLVVANGLFLEEGLEDVLDAAANDGANVFEVAPLLDPIPFGETSHGHGDDDHGHDHEDDDHGDEESKEDDHDHDHEGDDPHVWMDPVRMAEAARLIATELAAIDDSVDWTANAEAYAAELEDLDGEIADLLAGIPDDDRKLVTNHESMGYFADRYDFEMVGVVIPGGSTLGDPSSEELAGLVATMQAEGVDVVFAETTDPSALADAVAAELGTDAQVVELFTGSLGEPGSGAETYVDMMRTNAELIAAALG
ncbi:MAG: metal ABC transporter substrate-binding protein [Acidimicrobiia bacterium]